MADLWEHFREDIEWDRALHGTGSVEYKTVVKCVMSWLSKGMQWAGVLVGVLLLKKHHDHCSSYKENIHRGGSLTASDVQSIIMMGSMAVCMQTGCWLYLSLQGTGNHFTVEGSWSKRDIQART